jgi:dTDP-4-dehydrorhamnose 3,5-epimerase
MAARQLKARTNYRGGQVVTAPDLASARQIVPAADASKQLVPPLLRPGDSANYAAGTGSEEPGAMEQPISLPIGVRLMPLTTHSDSRGDLTEIIRNEWCETPPPEQWTVTRTGPNVMRGVHVHTRNWDYACVVKGEMIVGLHDLRSKQPTVSSALLRLSGARLQALVIPPGVAHGFYAPGDSTLVLGASICSDGSDDRACSWNSPELGLDWPCTAPELSARDRDAGSYAALKTALHAAVAVHP